MCLLVPNRSFTNKQKQNNGGLQSVKQEHLTNRDSPVVAGVEQAARVLLDLDGLCKYHHLSSCGLVEHIATDWITHACVGTACGLLACNATGCELSMPALAQLVACLLATLQTELSMPALAQLVVCLLATLQTVK